jgi:hypothetical protein
VNKEIVMEQVEQVKLIEDDNTFENASVFEKEVSLLEEMPPIESPAILWGKWGAIVS